MCGCAGRNGVRPGCQDRGIGAMKLRGRWDTVRVKDSGRIGRVNVVADDERLTPFGGLLVTGEIARNVGLVSRVDDAVRGVVRGRPVKQRMRGTTPGELVVSLAECQLAGGDFFDDLKVLRADAGSETLRCVAKVPAPQTALELSSRFNVSHLHAVERGVADAFAVLDAKLGRVDRWVTLDVDALPVEVYGKKKADARYMYGGRFGYQALVGTWAERGRPVAWDLLPGNNGGVGAPCERLLRRALPALPAGAHHHVRIDSGFYCMSTLELIRAHDATFTVSVRRFPKLWELVDAVPADAWTDADGMDHAQVTETSYRPGDWTGSPLRLVIRRVRLRASDISTDTRSRRKRTIPPDQLKLVLDGVIHQTFGYSFVLTNLDETHDSVAVEKLHRDRAQIEERLKDAKLGMGARHMPSGKSASNGVWLTACMVALALASATCDMHPECRASLDATSPNAPLAAALVGANSLTLTPPDPECDNRHIRRHGKALRRLLYCVPARITRSARQVTMHLPKHLPWADSFRDTYLTAHALAAS